MVELAVVVLTLLGVVFLGAALLPERLEGAPATPAMLYVLFGAAVFSLPLGLPAPDPVTYGTATEHLAEFVVIVALMGAGLKLDRPFSVRGWSVTWRLLAVTMPLTIAAAALLGWWAVGLAPAAALLLGAVVAPTDPVLASDVQVDRPDVGEYSPEEADDQEVRFALTSEAGLNDGLAFPFTYLAIAVATVGLAPENWLREWLLVDVGYRIVVGCVAGYVVGFALGKLLFRHSPTSRIGKAVEGTEALACTLLAYGVAELIGGYGFLSVFVAALLIRDVERGHEYNRALHDFSEVLERLSLALVLMLLGGAVATGLLAPLTAEAALVALALVFLVRPLAGAAGVVGLPRSAGERGVVSFFGIRGVGSIFYLAYGLESAEFPDARLVWAVVGLVVLVSVFVHGASSPLAMKWFVGDEGEEDEEAEGTSSATGAE
ncbi:cation:proton antiporter domain-containing protein [Halorarum salinum]|uniref:Cation:proton antiporter n=1 Tax=Halorarum salinum TaxID=2743089 RepID=A0A7D5QE39_9EURY|nr:cation:proton antiporter [Halobaculum salinum]QLG60463.1 cation:proton antiporter [Halobaculum salinum]